MIQTSFFSMTILLMTGLFATCGCQDVPSVAINYGFVVDYGQSFTLNCTINSSSQVTKLYWEKESNGITSKLEAGLAGTKGMSLDNPSLTIIFASMRDSGSYKCLASNYVGTGKSKAANITVHGGIPVIQTLKTNYTVVFGSSITMVCNVTAFPKLMHVNWRRNNSGIMGIINEGAVGTSGISPNNPSLTVKSTSFVDAGVYHCSATNIAGTERSVAMHLSVIGGTPMVEIPKASHSVDYGEEITIECRSSAIPKVDEIVWEKTVNGIQSVINNRSPGIRGSIVDNPSLTILNATLTDSGDYTCLAKNKVGTGKSQKTSLTVHGAIPAVRIGAPIYSVIFGSKISLHCDVTAEPEHTLVYWEKNNNGFITTINFQAIGTTGITLSSPSLTLEFPTFEDQGTYTCIGANAIGIGQSQPTVLAISGGLPVVLLLKPYYIAKYGETLTIECEITSSPAFTAVYWQKISDEDATTITAEIPGVTGVDLNNPSLTVEFVTTSDAGIYRCFAVNAIGIGESKEILVSILADIPFTVIEKSSYTAFLGLSIELKCTVQSVPRHKYVYWTRNRNDTSAVIIPGTIGFEGMTADNPSLVIPSVAFFMSGDYRCFAVNEVGTGISLPTKLIVEDNNELSDFSTTNFESSWQTETVTHDGSSRSFSGEIVGYETSSVVTQDPMRITTPTNTIITEFITETIGRDNKENSSNVNTDRDKNSSGNSPGKIAGIVIGALVCLIVLLIGLMLLYRYHLKRFCNRKELNRRKMFRQGERDSDDEYSNNVEMNVNLSPVEYHLYPFYCTAFPNKETSLRRQSSGYFTHMHAEIHYERCRQWHSIVRNGDGSRF